LTKPVPAAHGVHTLTPDATAYVRTAQAVHSVSPADAV
jgi:hypothetical protein